MTPFGVICRHFRTIHRVSLKAQALALSVSPSYISALERGLKGNPGEAIVMGIAKYYSLNLEQTQELKLAAEESTPVFKLPKNTHPNVYRIARMITLRADNLSEKEMKILVDVLDDERAMGAG